MAAVSVASGQAAAGAGARTAAPALAAASARGAAARARRVIAVIGAFQGVANAGASLAAGRDPRNAAGWLPYR
jgi:hypothetical protein